MKKIYLKLIIVISIIILSICSLAFADNNTINEIEDINMLFTDELINNVLNDNLQEPKELLENNQKAIPDKVLQDGKYRIAMYSNLNIGLDINAGLQENGANVLLWDWYEENNLQKQFNIQYDETDGYYTITNVNSGKLLTVQDGQKNIIQYQKEIKELSTKINVAQDELDQNKQNLEEEINKSNSPEYIEKVAREKLGMYLQNERVYVDSNK